MFQTQAKRLYLYWIKTNNYPNAPKKTVSELLHKKKLNTL